MDSVGLLMWLDTQLGPYTERNGGRTVVVWDNVSSHTNEFVVKEFARKGVTLLTLPKNMTAILQVIDLIINGPLKADQKTPL